MDKKDPSTPPVELIDEHTTFTLVELCRSCAVEAELIERAAVAEGRRVVDRVIESIGHWGVENGLHWVMDMVFRDDECRIRKDNAPANFTTIKHIALNLLRNAKGKDSLRLRRKVAAWDDDFLASLIAA